MGTGSVEIIHSYNTFSASYTYNSMCDGSSHFVFIQVTQHDHYWYSVVNHHLPEVSDSVLHWTLSYDKCLLLSVTLMNKIF